MHPADQLAVGCFPNFQGGKWSLVPACLHLSLVASACAVGLWQWHENMAQNAF
jgi:hypothetical protein